MLSLFMNVMTAIFVYASLFLVLLRIVIALKIRWGNNAAVVSIVLINIISLVAAVLFVTV